LTGLPFSNASLLDEASSAAEAMYLSYNINGGKKKDFFIDKSVYPFIKDTIKTRAHYLGINIIEGDYTDSKIYENNLFGGIVQNPSDNGKVTDYSNFTEKMKNIKASSIVAVDIMSLLVSKTPGEMGFDIAVGGSQRFGVPMMNGGPHAGFFAVREEYKRKVPGRVVGISKDRHGNRALRLAMQTREQHIRREKATSNICTAQALLANMSAFYSIFHGKKGLIDIATRINLLASILSKQLEGFGYKVLNNSDEIFDTVTIVLDKSGIKLENLTDEFDKNKINFRSIDKNVISFTINETTTLTDLEDLLNIFNTVKKGKSDSKDVDITKIQENYSKLNLKENLRRQDQDFLHQDIFNKYSSETQVLRYIYYLQLKDISLANSMIPLGSCTMKMNATSELV
jgi:glycine dehydrogenase